MLISILVACSAPDDSSSSPSAGLDMSLPAPDFLLPDVNPSSPSFGQNVGTTTFRGQVSAWYFGHST